ncbi:MAG: DUF1003 domain-containing protein [Planctomycetes bacterium]|nr:DUF1003 domain-containing protein [Planctomycetota bacterium]
MSAKSVSTRTCAVCGLSFTPREVVPAGTMRESIVARIRQDHPEWTGDGFVCRADLNRYRSTYVHELLESERGELSTLEREVVRSLAEHELVSTDVEDTLESDRTLGQRLADRIAAFGGSWTFMIVFGAFLVLWIAANSLVFVWRPVDPYPYILLNLLLSCIAAMQAPIIMMSQNRQEAKDRQRSQHDYMVNLKAELEIRQLHEKLDHLLSHQWERLTQIQEIQIELLSELGKRP